MAMHHLYSYLYLSCLAQHSALEVIRVTGRMNGSNSSSRRLGSGASPPGITPALLHTRRVTLGSSPGLGAEPRTLRPAVVSVVREAVFAER